MRDQLNQRLAELRDEHQAGQKMLADLDARRAGLTQTLLRIEGAMQVLIELLEREPTDPSGERPAGGSAA